MPVEVRSLRPRPWGLSYPVVAYCNADGAIVHAADMHPGGEDPHWDQHGFHGSKEIVCIDCKQDGREVPVQLPRYRDRAPFFRHPAGTAPGTRGHGETAEHIRGKLLIAQWAAEQDAVLPWTIEDELWDPSARLRSDVRASLLSGRAVAFEVQRKELAAGEWRRRHGGYQQSGVSDVWLWPWDAPGIELDLPGTSVVIDVEDQRLGVLVADYGGQYLHPTSAEYPKEPTHYASAPMADWGLTENGVLVPPPELDEYVGARPGGERLTLLETYRRDLAAAQDAPRRAAVPRIDARRGSGSDDADSLEVPPPPVQGPSMADIVLKRVPLPEIDQRLMRRVLQLAGDRAAKIDYPLYGAAVAAPETFRRIARHMAIADARGIDLWIDGLRHCERLLQNPSLGGIAACTSEQAWIVDTVLSLPDESDEGDGWRFVLRLKATEALLRTHRPFSEAEVGALVYAVWAAGLAKGASKMHPDAEISALALIAENLPALTTRRQAVRALLDAGEGLQAAIVQTLGMRPT